MGYYNTPNDEHIEPRFESGYEKGRKDAEAEAQETIDELVEALELAEVTLRELVDYAPPGEGRVETLNAANVCKATIRKVRG